MAVQSDRALPQCPPRPPRAGRRATRARPAAAAASHRRSRSPRRWGRPRSLAHSRWTNDAVPPPVALALWPWPFRSGHSRDQWAFSPQ
eukprot:6186191-Pyramimonas_sp.AAC.1